MNQPHRPLPERGLEVRLASRPRGWPTPENFDIAEAPVEPPGPGQLLVHNEIMSVDPYMRGRMNAGPSYVPPFEVGKPLEGGAVGEVIADASGRFRPGQKVVHPLGWREYALLDAKSARVVDPDAAPLGSYLGVLGMVGLTAYVGLFDVAGFTPRDIVFVSAAAGAVGSLVGQMARLRGSPRVIGSAGSAEKVRYLNEELGFDAAFNYKDGPVVEQLRAAAPDGVDVYFDNVGGDHLEAAIDLLNEHGRVACCGAVAQYNVPDPPPGPHNMFKIVTKRLALRGFIVGDSARRMPDLLHEVGGWLRDGRLRERQTVVNGLRNAPDAFLGMLRGENIGKMLVTI
ncbi:NADP-dependent oxidoreductase [Microtetraspora malaysiensis]|uniref:NADP-dependent oxidoreductase n=1 Tax=Microtetraspora malaysiensis TaxID=161358 RepID=UPI000AE4C1A1|nr:NADP-dependent oxidoreductase [Microtetraspora malaysiensis]